MCRNRGILLLIYSIGPLCFVLILQGLDFSWNLPITIRIVARVLVGIWTSSACLAQVISVSDRTGMSRSPDVQERIFDEDF